MPSSRIVYSALLSCGITAFSAAQSTSANLGSVAIGSSSSAAVTITIPNATTLTGISVLTSGAPNLDFTDAGSDGCTVSQSYAAGANCTVNVSFNPQFSGTRYGAVVLYDSGGVAATAYIEGVGQGPQLSFLPAEQTAIGSKLNEALGVAVDGAGNLYVSDGTQILKETLSNGSYTQSVIPTTGLTSAEQIAIDGAGNLYVADVGGEVLELTPSNGSYVQKTIANGLGHATGVAVDGAGNVYIDESFSGRLLKETLTASGYAQSVIGQFGGYGVPYATSKVAVDGNGILYVLGDYTIYIETPTSGGYIQSSLGVKVLVPSGIALDGNGNIYVSEFDQNTVVKITSSEGQVRTAVVVSVNEPEGLAFDGAGNLFVTSFPSKNSNAILKLGLAQPPPLSFGNVAYQASASTAPQTLTLENVGNQPLQFPVPQSGNNPSITEGFVLSPSEASACPVVTSGSSSPGTLASGASCLVDVRFDPSGLGPAVGSLTLSDNNLNAAGPAFATQTVQLSGTEVQAAQTITFHNFPTTLTYGASSFTLSATGGASGNPVTFTVQGPGVLSGSRLKAIGAGRLTVTAHQAGNADYLAAPAVSVSVDVAKAVLSVHAERATRKYGVPNPEFHSSISGFVDGDTATKAFSGTPSLASSATKTSPVGVYKIVPSEGTLRSKNYSFAFFDAELTVTSLGVAARPKIAPQSESFTKSVTVSITDATPDAVVHYTTNGTKPTAASLRYSKAFALTATTTVRAIAIAPGYADSPVSSATYTAGK